MPWNPAEASERDMLGGVNEPVTVRAAEPPGPTIVPLPVTCVPAWWSVSVTEPVDPVIVPFHVPVIVGLGSVESPPQPAMAAAKKRPASTRRIVRPR